MKKLMVGLAIVGMLFVGNVAVTSAIAADVQKCVTVPDAYVSRLVEMTRVKYMYQGCDDCTGLDPEVLADVATCWKKMSLVKAALDELQEYEKWRDIKAATKAAEEGVNRAEMN